MQTSFDFGGPGEIVQMRDRLNRAFGAPPPLLKKRSPVGQLVRSLIGSRTRDEVSQRAFQRLVRRYPRWSEMAVATPKAIEATIAEVTFADAKAAQIGAALRMIAASHPDFSLDFLKGWSVGHAMAWLEELPGVGPKVSAATLNFSTLERPAFVVDTHVLRILKRFGFVDPHAEIETTRDAVMAATIGWSADELAELHSLLKYLGQTICRADKANCSSCPLQARCMTAKKELMAQQAKLASSKAGAVVRRSVKRNRNHLSPPTPPKLRRR
jgi:endonuclease III